MKVNTILIGYIKAILFLPVPAIRWNDCNYFDETFTDDIRKNLDYFFKTSYAGFPQVDCTARNKNSLIIFIFSYKLTITKTLKKKVHLGNSFLFILYKYVGAYLQKIYTKLKFN